MTNKLKIIIASLMTEFSLTQFSMWDAFSSSANEKAHAHFESIVSQTREESYFVLLNSFL